jgi:HSP20 family molecular chaperone IbpA
MNSLLTLQNLVHPVHTTIGDSPSSSNRSSGPLHIIGQLINDPWYTSDELRRRFRHGVHDDSREDTHAVAPDFDARESADYYFLEGEFPGVSDKADVRIEWVGRRTLLVEADVRKVNEEEEWDIDLSPASTYHTERADVEAGRSGEDEKGSNRRKSRSEGVRFWLNERHTGVLQRSFTFPDDVDRDKMRARLRDGLVKILVPKVRGEERVESRRVIIED